MLLVAEISSNLARFRGFPEILMTSYFSGSHLVLVGKEKKQLILHGRPSSAWGERCKRYGQRFEPAALRSVQTYINPSGLVIEEPCLYISKTHSFLAATPDGIIRNPSTKDIDTVVEVKCPYTGRFTFKRPAWVLKKDNGTYELEYKSRYYYQVQAEMFVTGAQQCLFAVYNNRMTYLMVVPRDQPFIEDTVSRLTHYYISTYLPYLLQEKVNVPQDIIGNDSLFGFLEILVMQALLKAWLKSHLQKQ